MNCEFRYILNLTPFYLHFILYLHVWIRIRIRNTYPDPERHTDTLIELNFKVLIASFEVFAGSA